MKDKCNINYAGKVGSAAVTTLYCNKTKSPEMCTLAAVQRMDVMKDPCTSAIGTAVERALVESHGYHQASGHSMTFSGLPSDGSCDIF